MGFLGLLWLCLKEFVMLSTIDLILWDSLPTYLFLKTFLFHRTKLSSFPGLSHYTLDLCEPFHWKYCIEVLSLTLDSGTLVPQVHFLHLTNNFWFIFLISAELSLTWCFPTDGVFCENQISKALWILFRSFRNQHSWTSP